MAEATTNNLGCGCCQPPPSTTEDLIRELQARRDDLDARLARLEWRRREPVGAR